MNVINNSMKQYFTVDSYLVLYLVGYGNIVLDAWTFILNAPKEVICPIMAAVTFFIFCEY